MYRNPSQAPRCESCFISRGKGERPQRGHATSPTHQDSGSGDSGGGKGTRVAGEKIPPSGEVALWTKLAELRDLPAHDSLAAFPEELGEIRGRGPRAKVVFNTCPKIVETKITKYDASVSRMQCEVIMLGFVCLWFKAGMLY